MNIKFVLFALFAALCVACGDLQATTDQLGADSGTHEMICDPGRQLECACMNGQQGVQVCAIDGTHYLGCQCPQTDAGSEPVKCDGMYDPGNVKISLDCCDGNPGFTVCQLDGNWDACLCGLPPNSDAGTDAQPEADSNIMPNLNVMLAYDTPGGATLCQNASDVRVFNFTLASWIQNAITKGMRIQRVGSGSVSDISELRLEISNVYFTGTLVDQANGVWYFDTPGINTQVGNPTKLVLHASFDGAPGQHAFQITDATALDMITPANVTGSFPVKGNTFTISSAKCGGLSAQLASNPASGTVVKKSIGVDVVGLRLTAGVNDVQLKSIPLVCQASINGAPFTTMDCSKRITSLAIFDGSTQLGYAMSPNTDGKAPILTDYIIPNGVTKTFTVKATFASVASASEPYDKVSIGLGNMIVTDLVYNQNTTVDIQAPLAAQLSQTPSVTTTILPSGTISIVEDNHPPSQIVVAGQDYWTPFANYKATAQYEAAQIDRLTVFLCTAEQNGCLADNADFVFVAVASNGIVLGQSAPPASQPKPFGDWAVDVDLSANPIMVPKDGTATFQIWGKLAPVVATSVNSQDYGVARSGHAPLLGIPGGLVSGEWDANYADKLNVRTTGQVSGERLYADNGAAPGNRMVIRKTKPIVAKQNLITNVLSNTDMQLARLLVGADDNGGPAALKQLVFSVAKDTATSISNIRLRRGATEVPTSEYQAMVCQDILDGQVPSCMGGQFTVGSSSGNIRVVFANEDIITGSGYLYTLHALIGGSIPGSSIALSLQGPSDADVVTGYQMQLPPLDWQQAVCTDLQSINSCHSAGFLWSDQSEVPHSVATFDWTNGFLVENAQSVFWTLTN